jgi:hypothetical protein
MVVVEIRKDIQCVDNPGDITQYRQTDIDKEVSSASALEEDA